MNLIQRNWYIFPWEISKHGMLLPSWNQMQPLVLPPQVSAIQCACTHSPETAAVAGLHRQDDGKIKLLAIEQRFCVENPSKRAFV